MRRTRFDYRESVSSCQSVALLEDDASRGAHIDVKQVHFSMQGDEFAIGREDGRGVVNLVVRSEFGNRACFKLAKMFVSSRCPSQDRRESSTAPPINQILCSLAMSLNNRILSLSVFSTSKSCSLLGAKPIFSAYLLNMFVAYGELKIS